MPDDTYHQLWVTQGMGLCRFVTDTVLDLHVNLSMVHTKPFRIWSVGCNGDVRGGSVLVDDSH
jgi:hypothetical protein